MFSPIVIGIATSLGMDLKLLWIPMIMFFVWALYIYQYRGNYQLYKEKELSLIERARGLMFFFSSIVTFILNGFVVFHPTWQNRVIVIVSVGISLKIIEIGIPRAFFSEQTALFNNQQKRTFRRVLSLVGSVSIYYSTMVAVINLLMYQNVNLLTNIVALSILSFPIIVIYRRERKSRKFAESLAISLKDTRWLRRYEGQRKRKERKLKKGKKRRTKR